RRYAAAPSWTAREISCIRALPAGCLSNHQVRYRPYAIATPAQTSANSTAWSTKKSIHPPSRGAQRDTGMASARRIMPHKPGACPGDRRSRVLVLGSAARRHGGAYLLGVDLGEVRALSTPCDLALRGVPLGQAQPGRGADLLGDGQHPLQEPLDPRPRGYDVTVLQVDQLPGEPVADRTPRVLLDQAVRVLRERLALVERSRAAGG